MNIWKITEYDYFFNSILKSTEKEVAEVLTTDEKNNYYKNYFEISKKNGKRKIYAINKDSKIYGLQKNLSKNFLDNIMLANDVYGFVKRYSYLDYLGRHTSFSEDYYYIRLDIEDFFGTISYVLVRDVLSYYVEINETLSDEKNEDILNYILEIVLYNKKVVQGAITSPAISNIVFRQLDLRIQKYCHKLDIVYTRYADDMLFSSSNNKVHSKLFLQRISEIIGSKGFKLNYSKIVRGKKEISLNGYVVGRDIRISRKKLRNISRILFSLESSNLKRNNLDLEKLNNKIMEETRSEGTTFGNSFELINYLAGQRAFIISVLKKTENEGFKIKASELVRKIEGCILDIYNFLEKV